MPGGVKKVYLCGPIFGRTDFECKDWRERARSELEGHCVVLDPMARDFRGKEYANARAVVDGDLWDIEVSDYVLVNAEKGPSWGTAMEVFYAARAGKVVAAFTGVGAKVSPWLRHHCREVFPYRQDATGYIIGLSRGGCGRRLGERFLTRFCAEREFCEYCGR